MSQTFHHPTRKGVSVDFDLWAFPDMDFTLDFDLVANYAITGAWAYFPKDRISPEARERIEADLSDKDNWAGVVVGVTAVIVVNVIGGLLVATGHPMAVTVGTALLAIPDIIVYSVGYAIGDYFFGSD